MNIPTRKQNQAGFLLPLMLVFLVGLTVLALSSTGGSQLQQRTIQNHGVDVKIAEVLNHGISDSIRILTEHHSGQTDIDCDSAYTNGYIGTLSQDLIDNGVQAYVLSECHNIASSVALANPMGFHAWEAERLLHASLNWMIRPSYADDDDDDDESTLDKDLKNQTKNVENIEKKIEKLKEKLAELVSEGKENSKKYQKKSKDLAKQEEKLIEEQAELSSTESKIASGETGEDASDLEDCITYSIVVDFDSNSGRSGTSNATMRFCEAGDDNINIDISRG